MRYKKRPQPSSVGDAFYIVYLSIKLGKLNASLHTLSRACRGRSFSTSQVSAAVFQTALVTCSSERMLNALPHTLCSRVRLRRSGSSSQSPAEDLQSSLVLCSRGPLLTALPHTLCSRVRKGRKEVTSAKVNERLKPFLSLLPPVIPF